MFQETNRRFKETDRKFQEMTREMARLSKETDLKFQETDKKLRALQNLFEGQWGKPMGSLVEGDLIHLLNERGVRINDTSTRRKGHQGGENYEFDIIAHNGQEIVIVEVKTTLWVGQVEAFIEHLKKTKGYMPKSEARMVLGAIAYLRAEEASDQHAQNQGLFVIRDSSHWRQCLHRQPRGFPAPQVRISERPHKI